MKDPIKKHLHLLELTKAAFTGELAPIGFELYQALQQFASQTPEMHRSVSVKDGFLNTYGEKEWRIKIKAKNGRAPYVFKEQQVVLKMLWGIDSVIATVPDVSTEKKLQRQLFKIALPFYNKCITTDKEYRISRFENYLIDYMEDQYSITMKPRAFEKWLARLENNKLT
jgi:hypothetical protein